jgi:hypothetical protein
MSGMVRDIGLVECCRAADPGPFCQDDTDAILGAAAIIGGDFGGRHAPERRIAPSEP